MLPCESRGWSVRDFTSPTNKIPRPRFNSPPEEIMIQARHATCRDSLQSTLGNTLGDCQEYQANDKPHSKVQALIKAHVGQCLLLNLRVLLAAK